MLPRTTTPFPGPPGAPFATSSSHASLSSPSLRRLSSSLLSAQSMGASLSVPTVPVPSSGQRQTCIIRPVLSLHSAVRCAAEMWLTEVKGWRMDPIIAPLPLLSLGLHGNAAQFVTGGSEGGIRLVDAAGDAVLRASPPFAAQSCRPSCRRPRAGRRLPSRLLDAASRPQDLPVLPRAHVRARQLRRHAPARVRLLERRRRLRRRDGRPRAQVRPRALG